MAAGETVQGAGSTLTANCKISEPFHQILRTIDYVITYFCLLLSGQRRFLNSKPGHKRQLEQSRTWHKMTLNMFNLKLETWSYASGWLCWCWWRPRRDAGLHNIISILMTIKSQIDNLGRARTCQHARVCLSRSRSLLLYIIFHLHLNPGAS